jgi:hypothetical protein
MVFNVVHTLQIVEHNSHAHICISPTFTRVFFLSRRNRSRTLAFADIHKQLLQTTRKQRIDLELWYDRFPKSFLHSCCFHYPSLMCLDDRCDHNHTRPFSHFRTLCDTILTSCTRISPSPYSSINCSKPQWGKMFRPQETESHHKLIRRTKLPLSLLLHIN